MDNYQKRAIEVLQKMHHTPRAYASNREAFVALASGILEVVCDSFDPQAFYAQHLGTDGSLNKEVEDSWARNVVQASLRKFHVVV